MAQAQLLPSSKRIIKPPSRTRARLAREIIETLVVTALAYFLATAILRTYSVNGPSMQPTLRNGEMVVVNQLAYRFGAQPQRGDVVALRPPSDPKTIYVKRIIGVPGDTLYITPDAVYVNNHRLIETYVHLIDPSGPENEPLGVVKLDKNQYFVMGDNRQNSTDSRVFGYVPRQNIIGRAEFVFWPLTNIGVIPTDSNVFAGVGP